MIDCGIAHSPASKSSGIHRRGRLAEILWDSGRRLFVGITDQFWAGVGLLGETITHAGQQSCQDQVWVGVRAREDRG